MKGNFTAMRQVGAKCCRAKDDFYPTMSEL